MPENKCSIVLTLALCALLYGFNWLAGYAGAQMIGYWLSVWPIMFVLMAFILGRAIRGHKFP